MVLVETNFPRGGTIQKASEKKEKIVFGAREDKKKSNKKVSKKVDDEFSTNKRTENIEAFSAELLSLKKIQEGMIIMGTVKNVNAIYLKISLPGRMTAKAFASSISESYNKILKEFVSSSDKVKNFKPLNEMYTIGQSVYGKVIELKQNKHSNRLEINMSLKPSDVHSHFNHEYIKKGMILNGAVEEMQDHGYIIESGVKNLRCFLPLNKANGLEYSIGELVFFKIEKLTQSSNASTAVCASIINDNHRKIKDITNPILDYLMPSTIVNFTVQKNLRDGLQGSIMNDNFVGYINEHQLSEPFSTPYDYSVNSTIMAKILYVMPLTKLVYLSLNLNQKNEESQSYQRGDIIENALVHHHGTGGIILVLNNREKGILSFKTIKTNYLTNYDQDEVLSKYHKKSKHKIRILEYDAIDSLYICSDNSKILNEKFFSLKDCKIGEFVNATVIDKNKTSGTYYVEVGNCRGVIEKIYQSASMNVKNNQKVRCRIIATDYERNIVYLTNRAEYIDKSAAILTCTKQIKKDKHFLGTIVKCTERFFIIKFFNDLKGIMYKSRITGFMSNELLSFHEGQIMQFKILTRDGDKMLLDMVDNACKTGKIYNGKISYCLQTGLEVSIEKDDQQIVKGLVPIRLISEFPDLVAYKLNTFEAGQNISIACIVKTIFSVRDVEYFKTSPAKNFNSLKYGDILRGFIKSVEEDIIELLLPIKGYNKLLRLHMKMFLHNVDKNSNIVVYPDQIAYVKVFSTELKTKTLTVSAILTDVWNGDFKITGDIFGRYLNELNEIKICLKKHNNPFGSIEIGDRLSGNLAVKIKDTGDWCVQLSNGLQGLIKNSTIGKDKNLKEGQPVDLVVLWIDFLNEIIYCSHKQNDIDKIVSGTEIPKNLVNKSGINCKVLLKLDKVIVCSVKKGKNPLVFVPTKLHYNDFVGSVANYVNEGDFCRVSFIHIKYSIAVFDSTKNIWNKMQSQKRKFKVEHEEIEKKRSKMSNNDQPKILMNKTKEIVCPDINSDDEINMDIEKEDNQTILKDILKATKNLASKSDSKTLPGANDFWSTNLETENNNNESSSEDDLNMEENQSTTKKKKLTTSERFRLEKVEEARLRGIEENYANLNTQPETVDEFDRLVLSEPNNSKNWINYMVYHLQATEIDKARTIAEKALKSISFREQHEIINIWIALLNLELRYGTKESFNDSLKRSLLCNDQYKIYIRVLEILTDANKTEELNDLISTITKKFKDNPDIWKKSANAFFTLKMNEKAKQLMHRALNALPEREHVNTIVAFANLHHKHDDSETSHTLLEQVITSYPKRVDVWSQYVDILIKDQQIESARRTLERAVIHKIPIKKMRTLFKKYLEFEEKHGTPENVQKVKEIAANYVQNEIK